jgi:ribosome biogenesis GTPase
VLTHEHQDEVRDPGLTRLGWNPHWASLFDLYAPPGSHPARVGLQHKGGYVVFTETGEMSAELLGRMRFEASGADELPAVGDWVAVRAQDDSSGGGRGIISAVLPRKSGFTRKSAGVTTTEQVLAANIDVVFAIAALDVDLNFRRVERFLTMAWGSGAVPVVVMTKSDLCDDVAGRHTALESIVPGTPVHAVSAVTGEGLDDLRDYVRENKTATLLGASGSGKSTLVNALYGDEVLKTAPIRYDGKGRHTTTHRELVILPGGGLIIDTPGMRELQLWDPGSGLGDAFEDIETLAAECRFRDCRHDGEPGCAVTAAVVDGRLTAERLASFKKLQRELHHLELKQDARARAEERRKYKSLHRAVRAKAKAQDKVRGR